MKSKVIPTTIRPVESKVQGKPYSAVFFDFGNTLLDQRSDRRAHGLLLEKVKTTLAIPAPLEELLDVYDDLFASQYALTLNPDYYRTLFELHGDALRLLITRYMGGDSQGDGPPVDLAQFARCAVDLHIVEGELFPGAREAILDVRRRGLHAGIISDFDTKALYQLLEQLRLSELLDSVTTSEEMHVYKPAACLFEAGLHKSGCPASAAIYIGDRAQRDVAGAKGVGMLAILVGDDAPGDFAPDWRITGIGELPLLLDQIMKPTDESAASGGGYGRV